MALIASDNGGGDFKIAPEGQYAAVCYKIIDCGTQYSEKYDNYSRKVIIGFELHGDNQLGDGNGLMEDGKPFIVQQQFGLSLGDKSKLRPFLQNWRGKPFSEEEIKGFDITRLLDACCMLTIQHSVTNDRTYANITSISPLLKSVSKPDRINALELFELEPFNQECFEHLSVKLQDYIKKSQEFKAMSGQPTYNEVKDVSEDGIPF